MDKEQIKATILNIVSEQLGKPIDDITEESKFVEDLGADSLDNVELVMTMEQKFEIEIPQERAEEITSVGQAVEHIAEALKSK